MKRGSFIAVTLAAGGVLRLGFMARALGAPALQPNAWVGLEPSGGVLITIPMSDIGQGVATALAMALADELDADWNAIRVESALADKARYGDQGIGGSRSMRKNTLKFRKAGAAGRLMLVAAAAARWNVQPDACRTATGVVFCDHLGQHAPYSMLLADAATQDPPGDPPLKQASQFVYIGKPIKMLGAESKTTGALVYGIDRRVPGMLFASLERAPRLGATLLGYNRAVQSKRGVHAVVALAQAPTPDFFPFTPSVAVVADSYWGALQARKALHARWSAGPNAAVSSATIRKRLLAGADGEFLTAKSVGDVDAAFAKARVITADYETSPQAHATLEPQNAIADVRADRCEIWAPTQSPVAIQETAATFTGLPKEAVVVHQAAAGGGFGRRSDIDYVMDAVALSARVRRPVKVIWTREDDFRHDVYRPPNVNRLKASLDAHGGVVALTHRHIGPSIGVQRGYQKRHQADAEALDGILDTPYSFDNYRGEFTLVEDVPLNFGWWRAVAYGPNVFAAECFIDELAHEVGADSYQFRRALLAGNARALAVLDRVADASGWSTAAPAGIGRGIALSFYGNTAVAQVAEVSIEAKNVRVKRVYCAIDCGMPINPAIIRAQVEGGIIWALGATTMQEITLANGAVVEGNFDTYRMPRIGDAPEIETYVMPSEGDPSGVGESAVPPLAPAVCNAVFALTGKRVRRLPIRLT